MSVFRPQEKSAPKPEIDAAVNELKELKIALEGAVKARCGSAGSQRQLCCAQPAALRCTGGHRGEPEGGQGEVRLPGCTAPRGRPQLTRCTLLHCRCLLQGGVPLEACHAARAPLVLHPVIQDLRCAPAPRGLSRQASDPARHWRPLAQAASRACTTTGPPGVPSRPTSLPTGARWVAARSCVTAPSIAALTCWSGHQRSTLCWRRA